MTSAMTDYIHVSDGGEVSFIPGEMTNNRTTELLPCPFCGGSVSVCVCIGDWYDENDEIDGDSYEWTIMHNDFHSKCDLRSFHVSGIYRTLDCAEANEQKQRLIAAWNTRAELVSGTCGIVKTWSDSDYVDDWRYRCSECGCNIPVNERDPKTGDVINAANFCPNCGAKIIGGNE